MNQHVLQDRFFNTLVQGDRVAARNLIDECVSADISAEMLIHKLIWPVYEKVEHLFREDQLSTLCHAFATRLLRMLVDQLQIRLEVSERNGKRALLVCGPRESDDLAGQLAADLLEARGYTVCFAGGGNANDEIVAQIGQLRPDALVLFGNAPTDLPYIRQLIDHLHDIGACPNMQIVVGGGVFNRAEGLAEEIGADLWAMTPLDLVESMLDNPQQRMRKGQRTVGRTRQADKPAIAA